MSFQPEVEKVLTDLSNKMRDETPEVMAIIDQAKRGELDEVQVMMKLTALIRENPQIESKLMALAQTEMAPLRGDVPQGLPKASYTNPTSGIPSLNPLYEAALIERAQYDGDMPELRTGSLPEGVKAAVPVLTDSRNPIAIGQMLAKASEEVTQAIAEHEKQRLIGLNEQFENAISALPAPLVVINEDGGVTENLTLITQQKEMIKQKQAEQLIDGSAETDLEIYKRGQAPAPVKVDAPSGSDLLQMSGQDSQKYFWGFISTTQGRKSVIHLIQQDVKTALEKLGWEITVREETTAKDTFADYNWVLNISGPVATRSSFSILDTASMVLIKGLTKRLETMPKVPLDLEVRSIGDLTNREVGWSAKLFTQEASNGG